MPKPSTTLSDAFGTFVVRMVGIALMFVSTTVTARLLGPEEYGTYSAALALAVLLAALAPLGTDRILVRSLSSPKCPEETGRETTIAHLCTAIVATLLLCGILTAWFVNSFVFYNPPCARTCLLATGMFVPLAVVYLRQWLAIPLIGSRRALIPEQTILPLVFTTSLLLLAAAGWKPNAAIAASTYAIVMSIVWIGSLQAEPIRSVYRSAWNAILSVGRSDIRRQFRDGRPFVCIGIGSLLTQSCMPLVIAATCGFEETAYFSLALPYATLASIPLGVFNLSIIPRCARHYNRGEFAATSHAVRSAATVTFLLAAVLSIMIWICSPLLLTVLGEEFRMVCRLLAPLLLGVIVDSLTGPTIPVMQTMKMERNYSRALFAFIPIQLCLVYGFGKVAGIEGTAFSYFAARCLWNIIVFTTIYQHRGLVMLPYLRVTQAFHESPPALEQTIRSRPKQSLWKNSSVPDVPVAPARAA
ncbi:MAG: lipopolysaccharide biosynthesis protein [Planctomycetota bacterium]|nr:MAG: lipopolysaccharide biosynthesis protein [Planctomycetota bacterium]